MFHELMVVCSFWGIIGIIGSCEICLLDYLSEKRNKKKVEITF